MPHTPNQLDGQWVEKLPFQRRFDDDQAIGLATWEATLARCLVRATPTDTAKPISLRTRRLMA